MSDLYIDGYKDGLDDAFNIASKANAALPILREIRKAQGFIECQSCGGSGEKAITTRDIVVGLTAMFGARTGHSLNCAICNGIGLTKGRQP
jgi:hypothetical protein